MDDARLPRLNEDEEAGVEFEEEDAAGNQPPSAFLSLSLSLSRSFSLILSNSHPDNVSSL